MAINWRDFLKVSAALGGGLFLEFSLRGLAIAAFNGPTRHSDR